MAPRSRDKAPSAPPPTTHEKILDEGLRLVSERGVAGASLRELARRVGVSQPSLYHYFPTKEHLVGELVRLGARRMMEAGASIPFPTELRELPQMVATACLNLYEGERHPMYVRFLFAVSIEQPRLRPLVQKTFVEIMEGGFLLASPFVARGDIDLADVRALMRGLINAIGFALLEERALWGLDEPTDECKRYIADHVRLMTELIELRWGSKKKKKRG